MAVVLDYPIIERTTSNGLRVILSPDASAPSVAVNLWYRVGSADESDGAKGFAHLFEHLMFQGSAGLAPSEHLALIQAVGGTANATTSFDRTNYFNTVPPHALDLALWAEADRLGSLMVDQLNLDTQREVVKEEKRQRYDNVPYGDQLELLLELNFPDGHPYALPTIGLVADLEAASLTHVRDFHAAWYRPTGVTLVIAGKMDTDTVMSRVERYFGGISASASPVGVPVVAEPLPPHHNVPRASVLRHVPRASLQLCWRTPPVTHPDHPAVVIALAVLGAGQSSRLHLDLVRTDRAEVVGGQDFGLSRGNSLGLIASRPCEDVALTELEARICEAIEQLASTGPSEAELARVAANTEREWLALLAQVEHRADALNEFATLFGDPHGVNTWLARLQSVTAADVAKICATWLNPDARAVLEYHPDPAALPLDPAELDGDPLDEDPADPDVALVTDEESA